jgi:hypothetical protein
LLVWLKRGDAPPGDDPKTWDLHNAEISWQIWNLLESLDWKFLPEQGGLLDQPDWLIEDLTTIAWRRGKIKEMMAGVPKGVPARKLK